MKFLQKEHLFSTLTITGRLRSKYFDLILVQVYSRFFLKMASSLQFSKEGQQKLPYCTLCHYFKEPWGIFSSWWVQVCFLHSVCLCFNLRNRIIWRTSNNRVSTLATTQVTEGNNFPSINFWEHFLHEKKRQTEK